ncbi:hypothetical protein FTX61_11775 [Nitriliruptoraceae bacterium ZYF776]|nr:hypothetical protein [Profundirhabdus halotolerans]
MPTPGQAKKAASIARHVAAAQEALEAWSPQRRSEARETEPGLLERTEAVLSYVLAKSELVNVNLVTVDEWTSVGGVCKELAAALVAFADDGPGANRLTTVDQLVNRLLAELGKWPTDAALDGSVTAAAETFKRSLAGRLRPVNEAVAALRAELDEVREAEVKAADAVESRLVNVDEQVAERLAAVEAKVARVDEQLKESEQTIASQKGRLDESIARYEKQFSEAQAERSTNFKTLLTDAESRLEEAEERLTERAEGVMATLAEHRAESEKMVTLIATSGTVDAYGKEAAAQMKQADFWRWAATVLSIVAGVVAVWSVTLAAAGDIEGAQVVSRVATAVILFGVAGYAATQSSQHRRREERARRLELELTAFTPFIASLPDEKQQAAREALVEKLFGQDPTAGTGSDQVALTDDSVTLLSRLIDQLTRARGA